MTIALNSYSVSPNGILTVDATITAPGGQYIRRYTVQNGNDCLDECYPPWTYELVTASYYNWKSGTLVTSKRRVSAINLAAWPNGTLTLNLKAEYRTSANNNVASSESGPTITVENTYNIPLLSVVDTPELAYIGTTLGYYEAEYVVPVVLTFTVPDTASGLLVPITLVAEDNNAVTGWLVTENSLKPASSDSRWLAEAPTTYTVNSEGLKTLYAWAKDADGRVSNEIVARSVTVSFPKVTASPVTGTYLGAQTVTLTRANYTGGSIYYTLDGSDPTTGSAVYSVPLTVTESTTLKVLAVDADNNQGEIQSFNYVVIQPVTTLFFDEQPTSSLNVINYSTFNQGVVQDQQTQSLVANGLVYINAIVQSKQLQSQASEASISYSGVVLSNQLKQVENIVSSKILTGVAVANQTKQISNSIVREIYSGVLNNNQNKQTSNQVGVETFYGSNVGNQTKQSNNSIGSSGITTLAFSQQPTSVEGVVYYSTEDLTVVDYQADVIQLTKVQQQIANGALGLSGFVIQNQFNKQDINASQLFTSVIASSTFKNNQNSLAELSFKGNATQTSKLNTQNIIVGSDTKAVLQQQPTQQQITNASLTFEGYVTTHQLFQSQLSEKIVVLDKYKVTIYDPLQLQITSTELLQTKVTTSDPLKLLII